ncbi:MAG: hypothetical protein WD404_03830 [Solirubrobacterales bacterium]
MEDEQALRRAYGRCAYSAPTASIQSPGKQAAGVEQQLHVAAGPGEPKAGRGGRGAERDQDRGEDAGVGVEAEVARRPDPQPL